MSERARLDLDRTLLCAGDGAWQWDLDLADRATWAQAAQACLGCPALTSCRRALDELYPGWGPRKKSRNPAGVVWAGWVFDDEGRVVGPYRSIQPRSTPAARRQRAQHASRRRTTAETTEPASATTQAVA